MCELWSLLHMMFLIIAWALSLFVEPQDANEHAALQLPSCSCSFTAVNDGTGACVMQICQAALEIHGRLESASHAAWRHPTKTSFLHDLELGTLVKVHAEHLDESLVAKMLLLKEALFT